MNGLRLQAGGIELDLQVVPRAAREGLGPLHGDRVKVHVSAPPVDGAANEAVRVLLAQHLGVPRSEVSITRGLAGRKKTARVLGDPQALWQRVQTLLAEEPERGKR